LKVRRWLPPLVWAGVILLATSIPGEVLPHEITRYDKITHFTVYGILAVLLSRDIARGNSRWRTVMLAIVGTCLVGLADEWHQQFIPSRISDMADFGADALGASVGALAHALAGLMRPSTIATR
jgi:VanZ family protein